MIDWGRVAQLRNDIGEEDFDDVIGIFVEEVEGMIDRLPNPASADQLAADLHCLKGSALNLGFVAFAAICAEGEAKAKGGGAPGIDLDDVVRSYAASKASFLQGIAARST